MAPRPGPPFRADHVGSLLRPPALRAARERAARGEIDAQGLRTVEDRCIRDAVAMQESIGLRAVTDGEFRREYWHLDFLCGFDGMELWRAGLGGGFNADEQPPIVRATRRVSRGRGIFVDHYAFLHSAAAQTPKLAIPGPAMTHLRGGRDAVDRAAYPDLEAYWADLCAAYRAEIADLYAAGCRYLQIDDVSFAYLCDDGMRDFLRARGDDPDELALLYCRLVNDALADRPADLAATVHMCRGNFKSAWAAQGGYEPVAERVFGGLAVDGLFLEYDTARAGGFAPLRFVPDGRIVVLGLITSKTPELESAAHVERRVEEAARYVPHDRLCLSPQCGFSSTHHGNRLSEDDQKRKLAFVVEIADRLWGGTNPNPNLDAGAGAGAAA